jgi:hypothetical protein
MPIVEGGRRGMEAQSLSNTCQVSEPLPFKSLNIPASYPFMKTSIQDHK